MGLAISDITTADMIFQLNSRFAFGPPLNEMVGIHTEFKIFSDKYSLRQAFLLLHIVPADFKQRKLWLEFLDRLHTNYISDQEGVNGHDRIRGAYRENLESKKPLPIYMTTHLAKEDRRVKVTQGRPVIYERLTYLIISIPTIPRDEGQAARTAAKAAKKRGKK
jgi:hypothetical protein